MADEDLSKLRIDKSSVPARRGRRKRYIFLIMGILLLTVAVALYREGLLTPAVDVRVVNVQRLYPSQTFTLLNASGYVVAQRKAALASKITGRLVYLGVEEGSAVKKGGLVARLENEDAQSARDRAKANVEVARLNLKQAEAELVDARQAYERRKKVVAKGYVSELDVDAAEARYKKAVAALAGGEAALLASEAASKEAQVTVEYASIRAPFDAVVLTKDADVGDIVTPLGAAANAKAAVVTIADMNSLQVEADVSESNIQQVQVGQPCEIELDAFPHDRFKGHVHMIVPTADRSKASVMVKVAFEKLDARILPEMSAKVAFLSRPVSEGEDQPMTAVLAQAVAGDHDERAVLVVRGNRVDRRVVRVGREWGDYLEILDGVKVGERVVLDPGKIQDGAKVSVLEG
jgi:RND family efflux transporter MFP subunit